MRVVTSAAGAVLDRVAYLPFGQLDAHAAIDGVGFGGYTCEPDAQTWFAGPRFYDSKLGRFLSADAIIPNLESPIAYNRYAYANNNPMMFSDPSGRHPVLLGLLVGAVMGGINGLFLSYQVGASIEESIGYVFAGIGLGAILGASSGIVSELASGLSKPLGDTFSSILTSAVGAAARGVLAPLYSLERIALHPDGGYSIDAIGFISSIVGAASNSGMSALTAGLGDSAQYVLSNFSSAVASYSVEATGAAFLEQRSGQAHRDALNKLAVSLLSASLGAGGIGLLQGSVDSYTRRTIMGTVTGVIEPFALYGLKVSTWVSLDKTEQTPLYDEDRARFEASAWEAAFKSLASNAISQSVYMFTLELP
jgi:RHS repeat-associated protein